MPDLGVCTRSYNVWARFGLLSSYCCARCDPLSRWQAELWAGVAAISGVVDRLSKSLCFFAVLVRSLRQTADHALEIWRVGSASGGPRRCIANTEVQLVHGQALTSLGRRGCLMFGAIAPSLLPDSDAFDPLRVARRSSAYCLGSGVDGVELLSRCRSCSMRSLAPRFPTIALARPGCYRCVQLKASAVFDCTAIAGHRCTDKHDQLKSER